MISESLSVQDRTHIASADAVTLSKFDLSDYAFQGADFGCLLKGDPSGPSVKESMFSVGKCFEMGGIDAILLSTTVMDDQVVRDRPIGTFVGHSVSTLVVGGLSVSVSSDESLPNLAGSSKTSVLLNPCLGKPPVVAEEVTKGLACNPAASGMAPRSDGRGISAPTETEAVAHNVEFYHSGRCL